MTASNLHGEVRGQIRVVPSAKEIAVSEIFDLSSMKFREGPPVATLLKQAVERKDYDMFEFDDANCDD